MGIATFHASGLDESDILLYVMFILKFRTFPGKNRSPLNLVLARGASIRENMIVWMVLRLFIEYSNTKYVIITHQDKEINIP